MMAMRGRVQGFLRACEASGLAPHFVIDAGWQSEEVTAVNPITPPCFLHTFYFYGQAAKKWRKRREAEVRKHTRNIPLSADTFLADSLREAGAPVYMAGRRREQVGEGLEGGNG